MKSIRISDDLFLLARTESETMSRSIAQQLEHWARIGAAIERSGVTQDQVHQVLGGDARARERLFMKLGLVSQESMLLIPRDRARQATVRFPAIKR